MRVYDKLPPLSLDPLITFISAIRQGETNEFMGTVERPYDINVLSNLIAPLYKDIEDLSMWVYASYTGGNLKNLTKPSYDKPVYTKSAFSLPEEIF